MDIREYTSPTLPVAQFVERYVDTAHYDTGCRGCDNYGQVWVCPPYDFSVPDYWGGFREVCLRGVQLRFSPEEQARSYDPEELAERLRQLFSRTARQMILRLPGRISSPWAGAICASNAPGRRAGPAGIRRASAIRWSLWAATCPLRRSSCWAGRFCGAGRDACRSIWRWSAAC